MNRIASIAILLLPVLAVWGCGMAKQADGCRHFTNRQLQAGRVTTPVYYYSWGWSGRRSKQPLWRNEEPGMKVRFLSYKQCGDTIEALVSATDDGDPIWVVSYIAVPGIDTGSNTLSEETQLISEADHSGRTLLKFSSRYKYLYVSGSNYRSRLYKLPK